MSDENDRGADGYVVSLGARRSILAGVVTVGALAGVVAVAISLWRQAGGVQITTAGVVAMVFGILATLALGIGLMALVFISSRRGYDDPATIRVEPSTPPLHQESAHGPGASD